MAKFYPRIETDDQLVPLQLLPEIKKQCYLDESFMSRGRWATKDELAYIRSIFRGLACTPWIIADVKSCLENATSESDKNYFESILNKGFKYIVCDSNNRGTTVLKLMNNEIPLPLGSFEIDEYNNVVIDQPNTTVKNLKPQVRQLVLNSLCIRIVFITKATRRSLSDMFDAVNRGVGQNSQELRQSMMSSIAQPIRDLATKYEDKISNYGKVYDKKSINRRFVDELILDMCIFAKYGLQINFNKTVRDSMYQEESPLGNIWKDIDKILNKITIIPETKKDRVIFTNAMLRLWIERCMKKEYKIANDVEFDKFVFEMDRKWTLEGVNGPKMTHTNGNVFVYKNTGRRQQQYMQFNLRTFMEELIKRPDLLITIDTQRFFTPEQKYELWKKQNGKSTKTGYDIPLSEILDSTKWQADHVVPHSKGGKTTIENGELIEATINNLKSNKVLLAA